MKKQVCKILMIVVALIMLVSSFACVSFSSNTIVFATTDEVTYSLVPTNFNANLSKYNLKNSNIDIFTPFNFTSKTRMTGRSFNLDHDENNIINNQYVTLDQQDQIDYRENLALEMWIYFSTINLHDLTVTLTLVNDATITFNLTKTELKNLLSKGLLDESPYAWNKFVFAFDDAQISGEISNGTYLYEPKRITINFTSEFEEEQAPSFANLLFYDIKIVQSDQDKVTVTEKQDYTISGFNHISSDLADKFGVGDTYKVPLLSGVVNYAYYGKDNLLDNHNPYTWRVRVVIPDADGTVTTIAFGSTITFEYEGEYKIYYECVHPEDGVNHVVLFSRENIYVNIFKPVYFSLASLRAEVGKTYVASVQTSSLFETVSDITYEYDQSALQLETGEDGEIQITGKKAGKYQIVAKVTGKKLTSSEAQEYQTEFNVEFNDIDNSQAVYRIILYVILGVIGVIILISVIILVVKSRKVVVK